MKAPQYINKWLDILKNMNYDNTYKMAWACSIFDCLTTKQYTEMEESIVIDIDNISMNVLNYYVKQENSFHLKQTGYDKKSPVVCQYALEIIDYYKDRNVSLESDFLLNFLKLNFVDYYNALIKKTTRTLKENVSWRFKNIGKVEVDLYELDFDSNKVIFAKSNFELLQAYSKELKKLFLFKWHLALEKYNLTNSVSEIQLLNSDEKVDQVLALKVVENSLFYQWFNWCFSKTKSSKTLSGLNLLNWKNLNLVRDVNIKPVVLTFNNMLFRIDGWRDCLKIFYYYAFKQDENRYIESLANVEFSTKIKKVLFSDDYSLLKTSVKFSKNFYVKYFKNSSFNNLGLMQCIIEKLKLDVNIVYGLIDTDLEKSKKEIDKIILKIKNKSKYKIYEKNSNYVIAHINGEIFSAREKFIKKIDTNFTKKPFIGDIQISDEEEIILRTYMTSELKRLSIDLDFTPEFDKVFAFGLVRYSMKYYSQKTFWPYFKEEYGVDLPLNAQGVINTVFMIIMKKYNKIYDDNVTIKIDNMGLHTFVTDKCASKFFNYLFQFWKIDLQRNIENLYTDSGRASFENLVSEIKENAFLADVMKHTSLAFNLNSRSCILRTKKILSIIDDCFWNQMVIENTNNRLYLLLNQWIEDSKGLFQKEIIGKIRQNGTRGVSLLSAPQLCVRYNPLSFYIKLPRETFKQTNDIYPTWKVYSNNLLIEDIEPSLLLGQVGVYTEELEVDLDLKYIFEELHVELSSPYNKYAKFKIQNDDIRFFNLSGKNLNYKNNYIQDGLLFCFSKTSNLPQLLNKQFETTKFKDIYIGQYQTEKMDVFVMPNGVAVQVGKQIHEGIIGVEKLEGVVANYLDNKVDVFNKLPKILIKLDKTKLDGTLISVSKFNEKEKKFKFSEIKYTELKLESTVNDIYAYLIDLSNIIVNDGIYRIIINIANKNNIVYDICYIKDFQFSFIGSPYIFSTIGNLEFDKSTSIEILRKEDWKISETKQNFFFDFDKDSINYSSQIEGKDICLNYLCNNTKIQLNFEIPAFRWSFDSVEWNYKKPEDISVRKIPKKLFISGPFEFDNNLAKVYIDGNYAFDEESEIYAHKVKDEDYYVFDFQNIRSWLSYDYNFKKVNLKIGSTQIDFLKVICRSSVLSNNIFGDYEENKLYGLFDIIGDSEYSATIQYEGKVIAEDIPLIEGKFEIETELKTGKYQVQIYEIISDDSGFDSFSFKIYTCELNVVNNSDLTDSYIKIKTLQDFNRKYSPLLLYNDYSIRKLEKIKYNALIEKEDIVGLWREDFDIEKTTLYKGVLGYNVGNNFYSVVKVLLIFVSKQNMKDLIVLRLEDGEYCELIYDGYAKKLLSTDKNLDRIYKVKNLIVLSDDKYLFNIEIMKNEDNVYYFKDNGNYSSRVTVNNNLFRIENLDLKVRTFNCLRRVKIYTVEDISRLSGKDLYRIRNLGRKCIVDLIEQLNKKGFNSLASRLLKETTEYYNSIQGDK